MQMIPPPAKPTVQSFKSQTGNGAKRRWIFLGATATVASVIGIALGSTVRFQVASGEVAPLFKPQQDFPPLAEWPPAVPSEQDNNRELDAWDRVTEVPQLVYNDVPDDGPEPFDDYAADSSLDAEQDAVADDELPPVSENFASSRDDFSSSRFDYDRDSFPDSTVPAPPVLGDTQLDDLPADEADSWTSDRQSFADEDDSDRWSPNPAESSDVSSDADPALPAAAELPPFRDDDFID
ncbi:hypothetical protein [Leptothoe kymatousa]|uniref:Uncharacterized protein n=1 Tax=Leptothoe kymatousa TAU-MAC 1615 TaxID=2364775 RepID=A0ABS5Y134_9CYAN|nr:hypothetical protein [Leptothoe kymatousa]MBT9310720.1 hypothetical protein [Leptothoe kymatousa TAU-MAC 1615]